MPNAVKTLLNLDEMESLSRVEGSLMHLSEGRAGTSWDALLIYNANSYSCGTASCNLRTCFYGSNSSCREILSFQTGYGLDGKGVSLGNGYTKGMRNIWLGDDRVTWVWDGTSDKLK